MIKRFNQATSLLAAAAAVSSLVPAAAFAADYKRLEAEEGTIYGAVAYKGAFLVDGNVVNEDTDAVYYLKDGKYTELEDLDSGSEFKVYADKYAEVDDADNYVDLTNGKVTDDEVEEDNIDDAEVALRKKLKKVDRYEDAIDSISLTAIPSNKFAEVWYNTTLKGFNVFTDAKGNYIDADYNVGKIKLSAGNDSVSVKNTEDTEKLGGVNVTTTAEQVAVLGQDSGNVYRLAKIKFEGTSIDKIYNKSGNGTTITTGDAASITVIQKISKTQSSDDIDDAKYSKTVTSYVIADEDGKYSSDAADFMELVEAGAEFTVVNGKIIARLFDEKSGELQIQALTLKSKNGFYYTDLEEKQTEDDDVEAVDTDINGNVYMLMNGYVQKFDNTDDFKKVYKVDGSMDEMSIYDENNMIVWNEDDEVYTIVNSESDSNDDNESETVKTGWIQNEDGTWNYLNAEGNKVTGWLQSPASGLWYYMDAEGVMMSNGWIKDNGTWYYLQESGAMKTGWLLDNGTWYYLQSNGAMKTGWLNDNGTWYYLNASGAMLKDTTVDGYRLGSNGAWIR